MADSVFANGATWTVGNSPECDLRVEQQVVSGRHCRLSIVDNQYVLEDLGSTNGTFVNGYRLQPKSPVYVSREDQVTLGRQLAMPWPGPPSRSGAPPAGTVLKIGRDPNCEITLDYPMVSWHHAQITRSGQEWMIEDTNSANGTALNQIDNKIRGPHRLLPSDEIYLGSYKLAASQVLREKSLTKGESAFQKIRFDAARMVLGRDPSCDVPLDLPMVSWRHAALERAPDGGISVEDLGSRNGTYVDGVRITGKTPLNQGQEIGLGSYRFQVLADGALAKREYIGNVTIEVSSLAVSTRKGMRLLEAMSLTIFPSELVALMGPAGAGKTTFLKAVNGYTRPADGQVLFNGDDLYRFYDRFRQQMSYVPQDDIVHAQLTVGEALYFSAKLRTDLTDPEIDKRINEVLTSLDIQEKRNSIIGSPERKVLSGGQRKRVNIAMELIAEAPVIFLDEPTSGLSSYDAEKVIELLKKLAVAGTTIITTIHQPSLKIYQQFDNLIMVSRDRGGCGALAYYGPAYPDAIDFFDPPAVPAANGQPRKDLSPEQLLSGLAKDDTANWVTKFDQSRYKKLFVTERSGKIPSTPNTKASSAVRGFGFAQWWMLVRRNSILKVRDRGQAFITLVQAPAFALLLGAVFGTLHYNTRTEWSSAMRHATGIEFLMVVAVIWFGCNNVARDIVGEWTVFQRERMVSLKLPSYIFSKLAIAAVLNLFQCLVLLGTVTLMCNLQGSFRASLGVLYLASLVGSAIGLCISAITSTTEAAIAMLPLILLPMIALGGGLTPIESMPGPLQQVAKIVPSRWAFEASLLQEAKETHFGNGATSDLGERGGCDLASVSFPDNKTTTPPICRAQQDNPGRMPLQRSFAILGGMLVFWIGLALLFLRLRDTQ